MELNKDQNTPLSAEIDAGNQSPSAGSDRGGSYLVIVDTGAYEIGRRDDGTLFAACMCGDGMTGPDKGLTRANIAAWRTRHQDCIDYFGVEPRQ